MPTICLYLQAPARDFANDREPTADYRGVFQAERFLLQKPRQVYQETNQLVLDWLYHYPELHLNLSFPALLLEQVLEYQTISGDFRRLARHARTENLARVYRCPQSSGYSPEEFNVQVGKYLDILSRSLGVSAHVFHSKCLQFSNQLARELAEHDLEGVVNSHSDVDNHWRHPDFVYQSKQENIKILIQNQNHSDELGKLLRQNDPELVQNFLSDLQDSGEIINLFLDYDELLEGADFFEEFLEEVEQDPNTHFALAKQVIREHEPVGQLDAPSVFVNGLGKRIVSSALGLFHWLG
jgi:alpha-amylase/alpha-mannosidase (GH57 family)